jgi:beta-glucosidase
VPHRFTLSRYNKIQLTPGQSEGIYSCGNSQTLQHDLKDAMGFDGFTVSDWGATHSMSIAAGLDIEMPGAKCNWLLRMLLPADFELFGGLNAACTHLSTAHIISAIENDELELAKLDDSVMRILTALFAIGEFVRFGCLFW